MAAPLNYRHLYYFWVVAKEGGIARAAERLEMAIQTVSAQVRALEQSLGYALFKPAGRALALTEAGQAALTYADQIFQLGEELPEAVRDAATGQALRLRVGMSDGLPKLVVRQLLHPVVETGARLLCHEDEFDRLLADLALHRLDAVLSDRAAPANPNLRLYSHKLGEAPLAWFAPASLFAKRRPGKFPACLATLPLLLPTGHTAVRPRIDQWLEREGLRPRIAGEFEDSALLAAFGLSGMGAFPASSWSQAELVADPRLVLLGETPQLVEAFYLISAERRIHHPLVQRLLGEP
ncbi:transcriptional activator NhaR [Caenimonas sedimenti]|uniref:Transcriptional activator NhaR n=1 Tax=Caenimonas sedimenti TaxID=2596921 RepID=A0A562ZJV2_9BURK|nr:transcriptional activator NhaR [Caenimonas sedimenti]TWO68464.1 transcriptional activator NhaR [Caenimonas sedimenti]